MEAVANCYGNSSPGKAATETVATSKADTDTIKLPMLSIEAIVSPKEHIYLRIRLKIKS